jgi:glycosyltransferase involved in cell wall biosynthesis
MKIAVFLNQLGIGGTEKAACEWARHLSLFPNCKNISVISMNDGPRKKDLEKAGIPVQIQSNASGIADVLRGVDVIHAHAPGYPHAGDVLGDALKLLNKKIPVVQTNIFGKLENPSENAWTDFRLFISWTSCVQAAQRSGLKLDLNFFKYQSVASYPVSSFSEAEEAQLNIQALAFRESLGLLSHHVVFGRFSRPEPNKWTPIIITAFLDAHRKNPNLRLLLREPPAKVASDLRSANLACLAPAFMSSHPVLIMPATSDPHDLSISQMACDVILHTSSIGESFGYGIAEPMKLGKPVITNSVPWHDQGQLELVRHGETGLVASIPSVMKESILALSRNQYLRERLGCQAQKLIATLSDPVISCNKVYSAIEGALNGALNSSYEEDLVTALKAQTFLAKSQWGHDVRDRIYLRTKATWVSFLRKQRAIRTSCLSATK